MTTKQADRLIGKQITVRWPIYGETDTIVIIARRPRSSIVEARVERLGGRIGVFNCQEMQKVN